MVGGVRKTKRKKQNKEKKVKRKAGPRGGEAKGKGLGSRVVQAQGGIASAYCMCICICICICILQVQEKRHAAHSSMCPWAGRKRRHTAGRSAQKGWTRQLDGKNLAPSSRGLHLSIQLVFRCRRRQRKKALGSLGYVVDVWWMQRCSLLQSNSAWVKLPLHPLKARCWRFLMTYREPK